ncbi:hypothetical protein DUI87_07464 [Hirundo rustica rustica]|uniref:Uncharacterized protein n=1 Tax=Hirundo rustica rustica TaxID=333673 RepID=A0A3M0KQA8_HIRRU|nr:hypothetical protein DUI87_07464 [Hirundo rustica rustica]
MIENNDDESSLSEKWPSHVFGLKVKSRTRVYDGYLAALSALKQFSEQGLDPVEGAMKVENGSHEKQVKHLGEKADNKQTNSGTIAQDCKDSKAVV